MSWLETAKDKGVKVVGLESVDEQMDVIATVGPSVSATILEMSAKRPDAADDLYVTMLHLYREGRPADLIALFDLDAEMTDEERAAQTAFTDSLLVGRNATMAERAGPLLKKAAPSLRSARCICRARAASSNASAARAMRSPGFGEGRAYHSP